MKVPLSKRKQYNDGYRWSYPKLFYSNPIKHTDVLSETLGTLSVRLAILALMYGSIDTKDGCKNGWRLPKDMGEGKSANYFAWADAGAKWVPEL